MASPPARVDNACQTPNGLPGKSEYSGAELVQLPLALAVSPFGMPVAWLKGIVLIESLMNRTEPSANPALIPPGWKLEAADSKVSIETTVVFGLPPSLDCG